MTDPDGYGPPEGFAPGDVPETGVPFDVELERQVLGAMMLSRKAIPKAIDVLDPIGGADAFFRERHRKIYRAISSLYEDEKPADLPMLLEVLRGRGELDDEMPGDLADIAAAVGTSVNVTHHATIVRDLAARRSLLKLVKGFTGDLYVRGNELPALIEKFRLATDGVVDAVAADHKDPRQLKAVSADVREDVLRLADEGVRPGFTSGFTGLDKWTGGYQPGTLTYVVARPSNGKSAVLLNSAIRTARAGNPCAIYTLEMTAQAFALRALCAEGRLDTYRAMTGDLNDSHRRALDNGLMELAKIDAPVFVADPSGLTPRVLRSNVRGLVQRHGVKVVFLDYFQLGDPDVPTNNWTIDLRAISRSLKGIAKEFGVAMVVAAQASRGVEDKKSGRREPLPGMKDIEWCGGAEQDADVVVGMYWPEKYGTEQDDQGRSLIGLLKCHIDKNRMGPAHRYVYLRFTEEFQRIEDVTREDLAASNVPARDEDVPPGMGVGPDGVDEDDELPWDGEP